MVDDPKHDDLPSEHHVMFQFATWVTESEGRSWSFSKCWELDLRIWELVVLDSCQDMFSCGSTWRIWRSDDVWWIPWYTVVSWNRGTPKLSICVGLSIMNHPAIGGTPILGNHHHHIVWNSQWKISDLDKWIWWRIWGICLKGRMFVDWMWICGNSFRFIFFE